MYPLHQRFQQHFLVAFGCRQSAISKEISVTTTKTSLPIADGCRLTAILRLHHRLSANGIKTGASLLASVRRYKLIVGSYDLHRAVAPIVRTRVIFNEVLQIAARNVERLRPEVLAYRTIKDWKCFSF